MAGIRLEKMGNIMGRRQAYALYVVACVLFFLWALFPSEDFADYLETLVARHGGGITVTIEKARPTLTLGLSLKGVVVTRPRVMAVEAASVKLRPGYVSLLSKTPAVSFSAEVFGGKAKGKVRLDRSAGGGIGVEEMVLADIDLALFRSQVQGFMPGVGLKGILNAEGGYSPEGRGNGRLSLNIKNLMIQPTEPLFSVESLTFNDLTASMDIKSRKLALENCVIEGNEIDGTVKGSVFIREPFETSSLHLTGSLKLEKSLLEKLGKTMPIDMVLGGSSNGEGEIPFKISGMIGSPSYSLN